MKTELRTKLLPFSLFGVAVVLDQLTKELIVRAFPKEGSFISDVFGNDLLWIIHQRNKAIAFSIGDGLPDAARTVLFIAIPLVVLAALIVYYFRTDEFTAAQRWAVTAILGGGIGNLIDRIFRPDGVVDFVSVKFFGLFGLERWPTFNVADSCVVCGGILLFLSVLLAPGTAKKGAEQ